MHLVQFLQAIFALAVTLGLIGLAAVALRKFGPEFITRFQASARERRMALVETLVIDPTRRLVLIRLDNTERLILLGEGRLLDSMPAPERPEIVAAPDLAPPETIAKPRTLRARLAAARKSLVETV